MRFATTLIVLVLIANQGSEDDFDEEFIDDKEEAGDFRDLIIPSLATTALRSFGLFNDEDPPDRFDGFHNFETQFEEELPNMTDMTGINEIAPVGLKKSWADS